MPDYAALQPKDGDIVAHCGHMQKDSHAFMVPEAIPLEACDEADCPHEARWYMCCDRCLPEAMKGALRIGGHMSWIGDEPEIVRPESRN